MATTSLRTEETEPARLAFPLVCVEETEAAREDVVDLLLLLLFRNWNWGGIGEPGRLATFLVTLLFWFVAAVAATERLKQRCMMSVFFFFFLVLVFYIF